MRLVRLALALACFVVGPCTAARCVSSVDAAGYYAGDLATEDALARSVAAAILARSPTDPIVYRTGAERFDCQSAIAIYQMAILGLGQIILAHPEKRTDYLPAMEHAADLMLRHEAMAYAVRVYGDDGVSSMATHEARGEREGHAYLGYVNSALGMLRMVDPSTRFAPVNDRLTSALAARLDASPHGMIETYPGELWPPDVAVVAASIGLHASATHASADALLHTWSSRFTACAIDASGYLVQRVSPSCAPLDAPRGSGTALASYALAFAGPSGQALSRRLYDALGRGPSFVGFRGVREYAGDHHGSGDVNAGPMLFGVSVGATGFAIGAAKMNHDEDGFVALVRSANLAGVPTRASGGRTYAIGGLLGNALLLAMLTAKAP